MRDVEIVPEGLIHFPGVTVTLPKAHPTLRDVTGQLSAGV